MDQLEEAVQLAQINNQHLRTHLPGLVEQYEEILWYQHQLYDEATNEAISIQQSKAAEYEQMRIDTTAFATQVQGALSCLKQASSDAYDQLCKAWTAHTTRTVALLDEVNEVDRSWEEAANRQMVAQRAENKRLQAETTRLRAAMTQQNQAHTRETHFLKDEMEKMEQTWQARLEEAHGG